MLSNEDLAGGLNEARRLVSLRRRAFHRRVADALSVHALLLLDLPQDRRRRRLRDQHHGRREHAEGARARERRHLSRAPCGARQQAPHAFAGPAPLLRQMCEADPRWPEWVDPCASAVDTPLPKPKEDVELMLNYAAPWADVPAGRQHRHFDEYPDESIADWHRKRGLTVD